MESSEYTITEQKLLDLGLVDVQKLDERIAVHLVYSTPYNFMGQILYSDIHHAFLQKEVAEKLVQASDSLKHQRPDLSLLIFDAARPVSIQKNMWTMVEGTHMENYVSNPFTHIGFHNYGVAVDLTLMDGSQQPIQMGSTYDYFGIEAHTDDEEYLVEKGLITQRELQNRRFLRKLMTDQGFSIIQSEWWHFNGSTEEYAKQNYPLIDF